MQNFALTKPCWIRHHQHKRRSPRTHTHTQMHPNLVVPISLQAHILSQENRKRQRPRAPRAALIVWGFSGQGTVCRGAFPRTRRVDPSRLSLCRSLSLSLSLDICMYTHTTYTCMCVYVCIYVSMYLCMYVCMHACMHACMHVCMCGPASPRQCPPTTLSPPAYVPRPLAHSSQARPLIRSSSYRDGARPHHHSRNWRRSLGTLAQNRASPAPPSHTNENDGDDGADNDDDVLLACWYSECDCWQHHCSYAVLPLRTTCYLLLFVSRACLA